MWLSVPTASHFLPHNNEVLQRLSTIEFSYPNEPSLYEMFPAIAVRW
jgi:hypothetical protein